MSLEEAVSGFDRAKGAITIIRTKFLKDAGSEGGYKRLAVEQTLDHLESAIDQMRPLVDMLKAVNGMAQTALLQSRNVERFLSHIPADDTEFTRTKGN